MGDRGQVCVVHREGKIWLYAHWGGSDAAEAVRVALSRGRHDEEYLTRCIFDAWKGDDVTGNLSWGIGLAMHGDIEHAIPVVDPGKKTVSFLHSDGSPVNDTVFSFEAFAKLTERECREIFDAL